MDAEQMDLLMAEEHKYQCYLAAAKEQGLLAEEQIKEFEDTYCGLDKLEHTVHFRGLQRLAQELEDLVEDRE